LKRATSASGPFTNLASGINGYSYTDTNLATGITYYYVVSAVFSDNESANSSPANAALFVQPTIALYSDSFQRGSQVTASNLNNSKPDLVNTTNAKWKAPTTYSTAGTSANVGGLSSSTSGLVSSLPCPVLVPGFTYLVSADLTPTSTSDATTWVGMTFTTTYDTSSVYTNAATLLLARKNGSGQTFYGDPGLNNALEIAGTGGTNNYGIMLALDITGAAAVYFLQNGTNFRSGSLTSNQVANIHAVAITANGNGSFDNFKLLVSSPAPPSALIGLAGDGKAMLNWTPSLGASAYSLKRSITNGGPYLLVATNSGISFTNSGLNNGTLYYFVVSALNMNGEGVFSPQAVVRPVSGVPTIVAYTNFIGQLQLSWPVDHLGWLLQTQTNSMNQGLGTNWTTVLASDATNQMVIAVNASNRSVFFRLAHP
jgi:hypothetical protein